MTLARRLKHPHIIRFIGGFRQGSTSHILFEWADGGNLRSYWNHEKNWSRDRTLISWTIGQIAGLVAALGQLHHNLSGGTLNGRHGDLKPENILRSSGAQRGIFQIADLGTAQVHSLPTHSRKKRSVIPGGTLRYRPPQADSRMSRSYDMWSMGCIILEWIIWLVYGTEELSNFHEQAFPDEFDAFWSRESEDCALKPVVVGWIKHMSDTCLADGEQCYSIALRKLLIFVRDKLLVPDSAEYDTPSTDRPSSRAAVSSGTNLTPTADPMLVSSTSGRMKSRESHMELQEISSVPHDVQHYMYNANVNMSGPNSRGPRGIPPKLIYPLSMNSFRQEVNNSPQLQQPRQTRTEIGSAHKPLKLLYSASSADIKL